MAADRTHDRETGLFFIVATVRSRHRPVNPHCRHDPPASPDIPAAGKRLEHPFARPIPKESQSNPLQPRLTLRNTAKFTPHAPNTLSSHA
jgi:hypothetical protein